MSEFLEDRDSYHAGVVETLLEMGTGEDTVSFDGFEDFARYLSDHGVPENEISELTYPPARGEDLDRILHTLKKYEVVEWD